MGSSYGFFFTQNRFEHRPVGGANKKKSLLGIFYLLRGQDSKDGSVANTWSKIVSKKESAMCVSTHGAVNDFQSLFKGKFFPLIKDVTTITFLDKPTLLTFGIRNCIGFIFYERIAIARKNETLSSLTIRENNDNCL